MKEPTHFVGVIYSLLYDQAPVAALLAVSIPPCVLQQGHFAFPHVLSFKGDILHPSAARSVGSVTSLYCSQVETDQNLVAVCEKLQKLCLHFFGVAHNTNAFIFFPPKVIKVTVVYLHSQINDLQKALP